MASISATTTMNASEYGATSMIDKMPKFSPGAASILTGAQQESLKRGQPYVGSEHFLLSLLLNPTSRIHEHIRLTLYDNNNPICSLWKDRIISLLDGPLCGQTCSPSSQEQKRKKNFPPFSPAMLEIFEVVKQISSSPVQDGDKIISDGLVTSEFLVAAIMLHGVNLAAELLARASKGSINSWTILNTINVDPKELHVNRSGVRESSTFSQGDTLPSIADPFTPGRETLPKLTDLDVAPTDNSNWLIPGRLVIGSKPDETEAAKLSAVGVTTFVSLIGEHSFKDYQSGSRVRYPRGVKKGNFVHFPIADFEIPPEEDLIAFVLELKQRIINGECLFVHCRGGHGRTGTVVIPLIASLFDVTDMVASDLVTDFTVNTRQSDIHYAKHGWDVEMPETDEQRHLTSSVNEAVRLKVPRRR